MKTDVVMVSFHETQLAILDRIAEEGTFGRTREEAVRGALMAHVTDRLQGGGDYVGGTAVVESLATPFPEYGARLFETVLQPVTGKAVAVMRGEVLCIEQDAGGTCVDFNAFNLRDYKEALDCGFTRSFQSFDPGRGEFIWTNAPRGRPMFAIMEIAETCELDIVGHRCNRVFEELGWGLTDHPNCQDTLAEAIREYRLTPDDVHDSFNLWMATTIDENGRRQFRRAAELLALFDVLAVSAICGIGDLVGINNYSFGPIRIEILEATTDTCELADAVEERWGSMASQVTSAELRDVPVHSGRALERDPDYEPSYRPVPLTQAIVLELTREERQLVAGLLATGVYGQDEGEAVRAACMRWCNSHVTRVRRPKIDFVT